jgi:hypothetical protein
VTSAARLERPAATLVSCGIDAVDALTGGLPRGALTEICGQPSSGRTSLLLSVLAETTQRQETCALVDTGDSFDPHSAVSAGVELERLLWVRCGGKPSAQQYGNAAGKSSRGFTRMSADQSRIESSKLKIRDAWLPRIEQALKATDLLLQGGGFGLVAVDLADVPPEVARRVPLASWFRFRRAVEHTPAVLLLLEQEPYAKTCASLVLRTAISRQPSAFSSTASRSVQPPSHAQLFCGITVQVEVLPNTMIPTAGAMMLMPV